MIEVKETWILYQTTNICNFKTYIGVHKLLNTWKSKNYLGSGKAMKAAIKKYGRENFTRVTLAEFSCAEDAYLAEAEMVTEEFIKRSDVYNMQVGGKGGTGRNRKHSEETKAKISAARKGHKCNVVGRKLPEEQRAKIVAFHNKPETKAKLSARRKGSHHTEEARAKISNTSKNRVVTAETKAKMSATRKGKPKTEEHKSKISIATKGSKHPRSVSVVIDDIHYPTASFAASAVSVHHNTVLSRVKSNSPKWAEWRLATDAEKLQYNACAL